MKKSLKIAGIVVLIIGLLIGAVLFFMYAFDRTLKKTVIWQLDIASGQIVQLTESGPDFGPRFSPDGSKIAFSRRIDIPKSSTLNVLSIKDGSNKTVLDNGAFNIHPSWSPDGKFIYYISDKGGQRDIWELDLADGSTTRITNDKVSERRPEVSPDGKGLLFMQPPIKGGQGEIYIMPANGGEKIPVTDTKNFIYAPKYPRWVPNSREIMYFSFVFLAAVDLTNGEVRKVMDLSGLNNFAELAIDPVDPDKIIFRARPAKDSSFVLYLYLLSSDTKDLKILRKTGFMESGFSFSPDGKSIVYSGPVRK